MIRNAGFSDENRALYAIPGFQLKYDTFISYSRTDQPMVGPLVQLMRLNGRRVFWDGDSIQPGEKWADALEMAIGDCKQLLLVWCCHSADSEHVRSELQMAIAASVPIVPLLLCNFPAEGAVADYQWIDMRTHTSHSCMAHRDPTIGHGKEITDLIDPVNLLKRSHVQGFDGRDDTLDEIRIDKIDSHYFESVRPGFAGSMLSRLGLETKQVKQFRQARELQSRLSAEQRNFTGFAFRAVEASDFDPHFTLPRTLIE